MTPLTSFDKLRMSGQGTPCTHNKMLLHWSDERSKESIYFADDHHRALPYYTYMEAKVNPNTITAM